MAWRGLAWRGQAWRGVARQDKVFIIDSFNVARLGKAGRGRARQDKVFTTRNFLLRRVITPQTNTEQHHVDAAHDLYERDQMTTAAIINKLFERFGATRVDVMACSLDTLYVMIGARLYRIAEIDGQLSVDECVHEYPANVTPASEWIEGILRGKTRDDAGVLQ